MSPENSTRHQTAFTVSIEAREGVTTGISAADRAHTIQVAIDPARNANDIGSPGHVFPLIAKDGGVLVRAGHTEAAVDIARLAGVNPAGVICEVMNDDGSMARLPDLLEFAKKHELKVGSIADLISYRRRSEKLVKRIIEAPFKSKDAGEFHMIVYSTTTEYAEHVALVKGVVDPSKPVLVRMHSANMLQDMLGDCEAKGSLLSEAMKAIEKNKSGILVLLREPIRTSLSDQLRLKKGEKPESPMDLRDYGIGAQILLDLGVKDMTLLSNARRSVVGLDGYGLHIAGYQPL